MTGRHYKSEFTGTPWKCVLRMYRAKGKADGCHKLCASFPGSPLSTVALKEKKQLLITPYSKAVLSVVTLINPKHQR